MNKREIVELIDQFNQALNEAWNDLGILRRLGSTVVPNVFRHGDVRLTFNVDVEIYPPEYLLKMAFGFVGAKVIGVQFKDGVMGIRIEINQEQKFTYEMDLSREYLELWEYTLLLVILNDEKVREAIYDNIDAVSVTNAEMIGVMQFLTAYNQNGEGNE